MNVKKQCLWGWHSNLSVCQNFGRNDWTTTSVYAVSKSNVTRDTWQNFITVFSMHLSSVVQFRLIWMSRNWRNSFHTSHTFQILKPDLLINIRGDHNNNFPEGGGLPEKIKDTWWPPLTPLPSIKRIIHNFKNKFASNRVEMKFHIRLPKEETNWHLLMKFVKIYVHISGKTRL